MSDLTLYNQNTGLSTEMADELAKYARDFSNKEKLVSGKFIGTRAGVLSIDGNQFKNNELHVVVLGAVYENTHFKGKFDPNNTASPVCYAYGDKDDEGMSPHEACEDPQADSCAECPLNKWGSGDGEKGKACQNRRRLALLLATDFTPEGVADAEVVYLKLPVMSVKNWSLYVKGLAAMTQRPPFAVVTRISTTPDQKSQFRITFKPTAPVPAEVLPAVMKRVEEQREAILFPYAKNEGREQASAEGPKKSAKY